MALLDVFNITGSALSAQSVRLNVTASNLANAESVSSSIGETYRARHPVFATAHMNALGMADVEQDDDPVFARPGEGVRVLGIVESTAPLQLRYQPDHPLADARGYVAYPNVNVMEEMANMISASRSFQVNVQIMDSAKSMAERLLTLGQ